MRKKIGCVIAYRKNHTNYGTSLVGYALLKELQMLGYDVEVINYVKRPTLKEKVVIGWNQFRVQGAKMFLKRFAPKPSNQNYIDGIKVRTKAVEAYKERKLIPLFHDYVGYQALSNGSRNYDAVVVGSDQVWLPLGLKTRFFNLLFVDDNVRKVAYASSFGISVREKKGKEIVESLSHQTATVVADPTMLLNRNEWADEVQNSKVNTSVPYIFCYFLGTNPEARKAANALKDKTGLRIITLRHMDEFVEDDEQFGDEAPYDVNPEDFVSIQFQKNFMTFYRFAVGAKGGRNSRIDSLFNVLGVPRSHIYQGDISMVEDPIDWNSVDSKLCSFREESELFLKNALL